jgi:hypothetical protein
VALRRPTQHRPGMHTSSITDLLADQLATRGMQQAMGLVD